MNQPGSSTADKPLGIRQLLSRHRSKIIIGIVVAIIVAGIAWYWYQRQPIINQRVISAADFSVYVPTKAPAGYSLREEQTSLDNGILTYGFEDSSSDRDITVTVQAKPSGFDMSALSKGGSVNSIATSAGTMYNLSAGGLSQYLIDTGDSLLYITSPDTIGTETATSIANSLTKYN